MSIYLPPRGASLVIECRLDRRRFRRATGLPDTKQGRATAARYFAMLPHLVELGYPDVVEDIRSGVITFADAYREYRTGRFKSIPSSLHAVELKRTWLAWIPKAKTKKGKPISEVHRSDLRRTLTRLEVPGGATIGQLPKILAAYAERTESPRMVNQARAHCLAFARAHGGQHKNPLWISIAEIPMRDETTHAREILALSPSEAAAIMLRLGPGCGDDWWSICCSGLRPPSEFHEGDWSIEGQTIAVRGTKTARAKRIIPLIGTVHPAQRGIDQLRLRLRREGLTPYHGRHTFAHWLELAKIPDSRCDAYMGHSPRGSVRQRYRVHDVAPYIPRDRAALLRVLGKASEMSPHKGPLDAS